MDRFHFDNVEEFMQVAIDPDATLRCGGNAAHRNERLTAKDASWYGLKSPTDAKGVQAIVSSGWGEGVKMVDNMRGDIEVPQMRSVRRRLVWTDQGDHLNMDRVYGGQVDRAWQRGKRASCSAPANIAIYVDFAGNGGVSASELVWRGISAIVAADALVEAGHNVEIVACCKAQGRGSSQKQLVTIVTKPATAPMEIGTLAATTALTGFFRAMVLPFLWIHWKRQEYGCGGHMTVEMTDVETQGSQCFLVTDEISDQRGAQAWVNQTLSSFAL